MNTLSAEKMRYANQGKKGLEGKDLLQAMCSVRTWKAPCR